MNKAEEFLAKCLELSERASPPIKWRSNGRWIVTDEKCSVEIAECFQGRHDADFIVHAKDALPKVCEALRIAMEALVWLNDDILYDPQLLDSKLNPIDGKKKAQDALDAISKLFDDADGG